MGIKHILIFTFHNERFAVDAMAVKEIVWLPELTHVEEMPDYIVGVFNLRGHIVPVMDLNLRFGHTQERYRITDRVIIIECGMRNAECGTEGTVPDLRTERSGVVESGLSPLEFGIIVNDVHDVVSISESNIESITPQSALRIPHLLIGEVKVGAEIIMLLDHNAIAETPSPQSPPIKGGEIKETPSPLAGEGRGEGGLAEATPEELAIFHERALTLMQPPEELTIAGLIPLAVVGLNGEYYGVNLEAIREFSDIRSMTPVPCTPPHIVGDMNLRGDILTIVDIRERLNVASAELGMRNAELKALIPQSSILNPHLKKVVVAQINDLLAGIAVDEVVEVVNISPSDIRPVPSAVKAVSNEFVSGEAPYAGKMLSILDLKKILTSEEMIVEEEA